MLNSFENSLWIIGDKLWLIGFPTTANLFINPYESISSEFLSGLGILLSELLVIDLVDEFIKGQIAVDLFASEDDLGVLSWSDEDNVLFESIWSIALSR